MISTNFRLHFIRFLVLALLLVSCSDGSPADTPAAAEDSGEAIAVVEPTSLPEVTAVPQSSAYFFHNGLVITATGDEPMAGGAVLIEDGLITAVGEESTITVPENAVIIDLEGRTIMPGLIDARASTLLNLLDLEDGQISNVATEIYLRNPLKTGVTTLRAIGWQQESMPTIPDLREGLTAFGNTIPTVIIVGSTIVHSDSSAFLKYYPDQTAGVATTAEAAQMTSEFIEYGVDQVSLMMSSGPALNEAPEERAPVLTLEQVMAIVEMAHAQDKLVGAQAIFAEEALTAVNGGVDELLSWPTPVETLPDDLIEALVSGSVPVLSGFSVAVPLEGDVRRFLDAGGRLVYGSFAPNSGSNPRREFSLMELNGMTPMEMILSATANAAEVMDMGDVIGTLEVGKQADVIVVDGNPFEDNFSATMDKVVFVVKNGELVVQPE